MEQKMTGRNDAAISTALEAMTQVMQNQPNAGANGEVYIDNFIFCSINYTLCKEFSKTMQTEFEMSMIREFKFFFKIQINQ